jgi:hypothetical protein
VVARSLKKRQTLGKFRQEVCAETIYEIVRWKRLYAEIKIKEPLIEIIYGECFCMGCFKRIPNS